MKTISAFIFLCTLIIILYGIGLLNFLSDFEDNCEMTYMFEYPQFVKMSNKIDKRFPKYGLYAYSEGKFTTKARNMYFTGIPVLFIPGNAGSYKQVRSLASVALRKALNSGSRYHFDYFVVDFNDETSALYGHLLYDQLEYVNGSLHRILELYSGRSNKPNSIIVIGHSMGGVIAKKLVTETENSLISIVITMAAPLRRPPVILDYHVNRFYKNDNTIENNSTLIVSLSGGYSDFLIPSYLSDLGKSNILHAVTTNIPRCWCEANHIQIVWCKQLVLAINRALFDSINLQTKQMSRNITFLYTVFKHHFIHNSGIKPQKLSSYNEIVKIDYRGQWIESVLRQYSVESLQGLKEQHWYMIKLTSLPTHQMVSILAVNLDSTNWVYACNAHLPKGTARVCTEAMQLTHLSEIVPSRKYKRRYFQMDMHLLRKNNSDLTHIVTRAVPSDDPVVLHVDIYKSEERKVDVKLPNWWSLKKSIILEETIQKAIHYELVLPELQHIFQFYQLHVEPVNCLVSSYHSSATLKEPWGNHNHHAYFTDTMKKPLNVRLYSSKPSFHSTGSASVSLILDPSCTYRLSIKPSVFGTLGQVARVGTPLLLANIAVILIMILKCQISNLNNGHISIFSAAIKEGIKPYYILPFIKIVYTLLSKWNKHDLLQKTDFYYLVEDGVNFFFLPVFLFLCSVGILWILIGVYSISLITMDSAVQKVVMKFLSKAGFFLINWSDYVISALQKTPLIVTGILIFLSISICGSLALCIGAVFYFLKIAHISQDYIETLGWFMVQKVFKKCRSFFKKDTPDSSKCQDKRSNNKELDPNLQIEEENNSLIEEIGSSFIEESIDHNIEDQTVMKEKVETDVDGEDIQTSSVENMDDECKDLEEKELPPQNSQDPEQMKKSSDIDDQVSLTEEFKRRHNNQSQFVKDEKEDERNIDTKTVTDSFQANNELTDTYKTIIFHTTIFFIWCTITVLNLPAAITWAHNYKYSKILTPDDSLIPGLALSFCSLPLWQLEFPKIGKWGTHLGKLLTVICMLILTSGIISLYRLNYLLTLSVVIITLHQMFAPETEEATQPDDYKEDSHSKYDNIKMKLS